MLLFCLGWEVIPVIWYVSLCLPHWPLVSYRLQSLESLHSITIGTVTEEGVPLSQLESLGAEWTLVVECQLAQHSLPVDGHTAVKTQAHFAAPVILTSGLL